MQINKNDIVSIDFETFYGVGYSLTDKDINMSEYVRHEKFKIHCMAIKMGEGPVEVYRGEDVARVLGSIDWSTKYVLAHNTAFDGFILSDRFGIVPKGYLDTLCMSRGIFGAHVSHKLDDVAKRLGLGEKIKGALDKTKDVRELPEESLTKLMEYCGVDTTLCYNVFNVLHRYFPDVELALVDLTLRMFCEPKLVVDQDLVEKERVSEVNKKAEALAALNKMRKDLSMPPVSVEDLMSNDKFAELLREHNITPPTKISKTTGRSTYAFAKTDPQFQFYAEQGDAVQKTIFQARLKNKTSINETRAARLSEGGKDKLPLPVLLNYYGAHTGRWSGGNKLNLQNLQRGGSLRRSLRAPSGMVIVVADSSQIEARTTAWLADEHRIIQGFKEKTDVYKEMASRIYGIPAEQITDEQRFVGKTCILGLGYGMGAAKLKATLALGINGPKVELSLRDCERIVHIYRSTYFQIPTLWKGMQAAIDQMVREENGQFKFLKYGGDITGGFVRLPNQMKLLYPELMVDDHGDTLYTTRYGHTKLYGGLLTENIVQALARIIVGDQMLKIAERYPVVMMAHDEIVWLAPESEAQESLNFGIQVMSTVPAWAEGLPLEAKGGFDHCYSK